MILQAHRGDSKRFPENTMSAFNAAYNEGYGIIELDMKFTKDGKCCQNLPREFFSWPERKEGQAVSNSGLELKCF